MPISRSLVVVLATGLLAAAAPPLANVTTAPGVLINGKELPQKTAPAWPLAANDQVSTNKDPAILMIAADRALMEPGTTVRMLERGGIVRLELDAGQVCLRTRSGSNLQVFVADDELTVHTPFEGTVTMNAPGQTAPVVKPTACHFPASGLLLNRKVVIPATGAAAAAAAATAARVATGEAVPAASPSRP